MNFEGDCGENRLIQRRKTAEFSHNEWTNHRGQVTRGYATILVVYNIRLHRLVGVRNHHGHIPLAFIGSASAKE